MAESAAYFGRPLDATLVRRRLRALARRLPRAEHRVRVLAAKDGTVRCEAALLRPPGPGAAARVALAASPVDSGSVFLYHKTTNRRAYEEALAARPGYDDVLLYNGKGEVTESAIGNVAVRIGGALCTPPVRCGLLAGTQRALMLRRGELVERAISVDEALRSRGIYLMNSVRGMYPARLERPGRAAPGRRSRRHA
jgi:para-aminobenzoate synthetase/4-amino-4-deoxychorismate lyase